MVSLRSFSVLLTFQSLFLSPSPPSWHGRASGVWESGGVRQNARGMKAPCSRGLDMPQISDMMTELQVGAISKMKVHPGMLMKTNDGRFQVSGARCQASRA